MNPAKQLKKRIEAGETITGVLATFHLWPGFIETAMRAGLDYVIIDREHGAHSDELTAEVCAVGRRNDFAVFVRPIDTEYSTIRRAIDLGPCGLLLPTIEGTGQLDRVASAIRLPPRGNRRPGGHGNHWVSGYGYDAWRTEVEDDFIVLPQIENTTGLENADAIASHEITTAIAIGPYDLSADLGICGDLDDPRLVEAESRIREAGRTTGKAMWVIGDAATLVKRGHTFLCIGEPIVMLEKTLAAAREAL